MQSLTAARPYGCDKDKDPAALLPASPGLHWLPRPFPGCSSSQNRLERGRERPLRPPTPQPLLAPLYPAEGPWASAARPRAASARRTWPRTRSRASADTRLPACSCARSLVSAPACLLLCPCLPRALPASPAASTKGFVRARAHWVLRLNPSAVGLTPTVEVLASVSTKSR